LAQQISETISSVDFLLAHSSASSFEFAISGKPSVLLDRKAALRASLEAADISSGPMIFESVGRLLKTVEVFSEPEGLEFHGPDVLLDIIESR
jgi:hypothetical protein